MATLAEVFTLKNSSSLRNRLAVALCKSAENVRTELSTVANHAERFAWAKELLSGATKPEEEAKRAMWIFLQNSTIQTAGEASTDNDIGFVSDGLVNFLAGVDTSTAE